MIKLARDDKKNRNLRICRNEEASIQPIRQILNTYINLCQVFLQLEEKREK